MLTNVLREMRRYFVRESVTGRFALQSGLLTPSPPSGYAHIAISGSKTHDGVYAVLDGRLYDADDHAILPEDGEFDCTLYALHIPRDVLRLADEAAAWQAAASTPVTGESFGGYQRTLATGASGAPVTWQMAFAQRLAPYRRMFPEVRL